MKPVMLKLQGLNSFEQMQTVDFGKLARDGLFGIVGPTGSGKTSIVDAITLALYGEVSRYDGDRGGPAACMNANSDTTQVSFVFRLTHHGRDILYTAERVYRRQAGNIKQTISRLTAEIDGQIEILADSANKMKSQIIELTGLTYDDFTRCVVLPQGKFSRFLLLANEERRKMLERIFNFERYGVRLGKRINSEINERRNKLETLQAALDVYGNITDASIAAEKASYKELQLRFESLERERAEANNAYVRCKRDYEAHMELTALERELAEMLGMKPEIEEKRGGMANIQKARSIRPVYEAAVKTRALSHENTAALDSVMAELTMGEALCGEAETAWVEAARMKDIEYPGFLERERQVRQALELSHELAEQEKESSALSVRNEKMLEKQTSLASALEMVQKEREGLQAVVETIAPRKKADYVAPEVRQKAADGSTLQKKRLEASVVFKDLKAKYQTRETHLSKNRQVLLAAEERLELLTKEMEKHRLALSEIAPEDSMVFASKGEALALCENALKQAREKFTAYEKNKAELNDRQHEYKQCRTVLDEKKQASERMEREGMAHILAHGLTDGQPCPVCGSLPHPAPAQPMLGNDEVVRRLLSDEITPLQEKVENLRGELLYLEKATQEYETSAISPTTLEKQYKELSLEYTTLRDGINSRDRSRRDIEEKLQVVTSEANEMSIKKAGLAQSVENDKAVLTELKLELEERFVQLNEMKEELEQYKLTLGAEDFVALYVEIQEKDKSRHKAEEEEERALQQIKALDIKIMGASTALSETTAEVQRLEISLSEKMKRCGEINDRIERLCPGKEPSVSILEIQKEMEILIRNEEAARKKREELQIQIRRLYERKSGLTTQRETLDILTAENNEKLVQVIAACGFDEACDVTMYFASDEELATLTEAVRQYDEAVRDISRNAVALKQKLDGREREGLATGLANLEKRLAEMDEQLQKFTGEIAVALANIEKNIQNLVEVKRLMSEKKETVHKLDLLMDISGVLAAGNFAERLSKAQLTYISADATKRLKEMTGNRYALELYGTDFVIRDDFNGGIRRSPKTLSGGETFIVSLCLSLALSSKIQLKNNAPLEFFFLDEGFGTLDGDAVDIVMTALERLQTERLSVGVITHVEELKLRLNSKLVVVPASDGAGGTTVYLD